MTIHDMTAGVMPHHLARSRFMITDILGGPPPPPSPASSPDRPRDLSLRATQPSSNDNESDGHESGTDSGVPGDTSSVGSNGEYLFYLFPSEAL
jgi:hypothetical protein